MKGHWKQFRVGSLLLLMAFTAIATAWQIERRARIASQTVIDQLRAELKIHKKPPVSHADRLKQLEAQHRQAISEFRKMAAKQLQQ